MILLEIVHCLYCILSAFGSSEVCGIRIVRHWHSTQISPQEGTLSGNLPVGGADTGSRSHVHGEKTPKTKLVSKGKVKCKFYASVGPKRYLNSMNNMMHSGRWGNWTRHWNIRTSSLGRHFNTLALRGQLRSNSIRETQTHPSEDMLVINLHTLSCPGILTAHNQGTWSFSFSVSWIRDKRLMGRTSIIPTPFW